MYTVCAVIWRGLRMRKIWHFIALNCMHSSIRIHLFMQMMHTCSVTHAGDIRFILAHPTPSFFVSSTAYPPYYLPTSFTYIFSDLYLLCICFVCVLYTSCVCSCVCVSVGIFACFCRFTCVCTRVCMCVLHRRAFTAAASTPPTSRKRTVSAVRTCVWARQRLEYGPLSCSSSRTPCSQTGG